MERALTSRVVAADGSHGPQPLTPFPSKAPTQVGAFLISTQHVTAGMAAPLWAAAVPCQLLRIFPDNMFSCVRARMRNGRLQWYSARANDRNHRQKGRAKPWRLISERDRARRNFRFFCLVKFNVANIGEMIGMLSILPLHSGHSYEVWGSILPSAPR